MSAGRGWRAATLTAVGPAGVAVLLPLAAFLVSVWLLGWQLQAVLTGSMAPAYPRGSLLVVGQIDASAVEVGMPIVFEDPGRAGRIMTHRVVGLTSGDNLAFITRGDGNGVDDPVPVPARLVRGRVLWSVSHLGSLLQFLQWPNGFLLFVVLPGLVLLGTELRDRGVSVVRRPAVVPSDPDA